MDSGRPDQGLQFLLKAAEMYPNDFQSLTNAAGALRYNKTFALQSAGSI